MARAGRSRGKAEGKRPPRGTKSPEKSESRIRWPLGWAGNVITAAVIATVTTAVTAGVNGVFDRDKQPGVKPGLPVLIDSVTVSHDNAGVNWAFPRAMKLTTGELAGLNSQLDAGSEDSWFERHGGVEAGGESLVQVIVTGNARGGARITNITLAKHCQPPLTGTIFSIAPENAQPSIRINFDLDQPAPVARTPSGQDFFTRSTIMLQAGEQQVLEFRTTTQRSYCSYRLALTALANGKSVMEPVPAPGAGFKVLALSPRYASVYRGRPDAEGSTRFTAVPPGSWHIRETPGNG